MTVTAAQTAVFNKVAGGIKAGAITNFSSLVQELTADGMQLEGQEAEDFGNLIDNFTQGIEAGQTPSAAWTAAYAPFIAAEKSQLWADAVQALQQVTSFIDSVVSFIEAAI